MDNAPSNDDPTNKLRKSSRESGRQSLNRIISIHPGNVQELAADDLLGEMGYTAELVRSRSTLQAAFMSFVLASIPYGLATSLYYPLINGGPATVVWGWVAVSLIIFCVAASLGEITSIYPTAGGVYYQTYMLSPEKWRRITSWICGWAYLAGNIIITLAVTLGTTQFLVACINVFELEPGVGIFEAQPYQIYLIFVGITLSCNAFTAFANRWLPILDTFAIFWTFAGLIAMVICCLVIAKEGHRSGSYALGYFESQSGWPGGWSFCVGLLHAAYATSSTGMIISMCEEVQSPSIQVPKAMVATIVINTIVGLLFLIPLMFVLPDLTMLINLASAQPTPTILKSAIGTSGGAFALLIPFIVLAFICGVGCTTAASRCTWAFARDGAIPVSHWCKRVNRTLNVPLNAQMLSMGVQLILGLIYLGSASAFNAFSASGVICLTLSYAMPVAVSLFTGRKQIKGCKFDLGLFGIFCNVVTICWSLFAIPLLCMPSYVPVTGSTVNYASVVFVGFTAIASGWYWIWGHENYRGPPQKVPGQNDPIVEDHSSK